MSEPTYYARVIDGIVEGVYVADEAWVKLQAGEWIHSTDTNRAYQGAPVVDGVFIQPTITPDVFVAPPTESKTPDV